MKNVQRDEALIEHFSDQGWQAGTRTKQADETKGRKARHK
jgi:hypothetical protein